ncbi:MAG: 4-hydroxythreonine-4-phosphate dehydrogenase PdxA, partial [Rhodothermales bacterium]|nr:4-hydroxythreonine-4-phosphate dehydrogenase PdxA [Rhodothermales bacterium]
MTGAHRPRLAVSIGDPNGIGPEVALKVLAEPVVNERCDAVLVGDERVIQVHAERLGLSRAPVPVEHVSAIDGFAVDFGRVSREAGAASMAAVARAADLCMEGTCDAMVTAPICKEAIDLAGHDSPGHTEFLAGRTGTSDYLMMMVAGGLRVGVVTGHVPLREVAARITVDSVSRCLNRMAASLRADFGVREPRIAVLGLNPHAGDGGVLGSEEAQIIEPAMARVRGEAVAVDGPFPADGFFAERSWEDYDAVLAMYHDQGLIPFKTLAFDTGVNFTAGLPIVRTSPDHGTAFDIAGRGL